MTHNNKKDRKRNQRIWYKKYYRQILNINPLSKTTNKTVYELKTQLQIDDLILSKKTTTELITTSIWLRIAKIGKS